MVRNTVGVVVGAVVWMLLFMAVAIGLGQLWPDYAAHGREWFSQRTYTFPPGQSIAPAVWFGSQLARPRKAAS